MDWLDLSLKFSSEIVVLVLALTVGILNLFFFSGHKIFADNSHASKLLSYHSTENPKLYGKLTSINTVVVSQNSLFPKASADDFLGVAQASAESDTSTDPSSSIIEGGAIAQGNITTTELMAKQVKVYETQAGDTLSSIAQANGIKPETIIWANNLPSTTIKPGWQLIILPTDGILVKADSNTTLPDIAAKYNPQRYNSDKAVIESSADKLLQKIIDYNGLASAEDIDDGQLIIVPGGAITQAPAPTPKPKPKVTTGSGASDAVTSVGSGYDGENHLFPKGYCTWYVATRMKITFGGNAKNWLANAKASGYVTGKEPAVHSAVITTEDKRYGHVAYVEKVEDGKILVSEMNYIGFNKVDQRWISINSPIIRGYIYP